MSFGKGVSWVIWGWDQGRTVKDGKGEYPGNFYSWLFCFGFLFFFYSIVVGRNLDRGAV